MMSYAGGIWMGLGEDDLGPGGEYPAVLPVVVYHGEKRWSAATDIHDLLAPNPENEGLERGRLEGERAIVYRLVARRFGPGAAEQLVPVLDAITDPELVAAVADAVVECQTATEFIGRVKEVVGR